jgi:hypothetical protein
MPQNREHAAVRNLAPPRPRDDGPSRQHLPEPLLALAPRHRLHDLREPKPSAMLDIPHLGYPPAREIAESSPASCRRLPNRC